MSDLLGQHLGLLDAGEVSAAAARLQSRFGGEAGVAAKRALLQRVLAPLDADTLPAPRADLVQAVLARVEASRSIPFRMKQPAADEGRAGGGSPFSLRELVGVAAAIALFAGIFVPGYRTARNAATRILCQDNLRQIGTGLASYGAVNNGYLPFAVGPSNGPFGTMGVGGAPRVNNPGNINLVSGNLSSSDILQCPAREDHSTYSSQLMSRPMQWNAFDSRMPIASDFNPEFDRQVNPFRGGSILNSQSHGRPSGQNVLYFHGGVRWTSSPNVGIGGDDIYRIDGVREFTGVESPRFQTDAFLVP